MDRENEILARVIVVGMGVVFAASFMIFGYVVMRGLEAIYDDGNHWGALFMGVGASICFLPLGFLLERLEAQSRQR